MREKSKEENVNYDYCEIETKNVELENSVAKLLSKNVRLCKEINHVKQVFKDQFDSIKKIRVRTKEQSDSLIDKLNLKCAENEDLKAQIQDKVFVITSLKNDLRKLKGKEIIEIASTEYHLPTPIVPRMFKLDLNLWILVIADQSLQHIKEYRISQTTSRNIKNKVEAQPRKVNKKNRVVEPIRDVDVKHSLLKAISELICATCKKSMFDDVHDMCLLDFVENVNSRAKSAKKHKKQNIWKPTGHVFTEVGLKWKPTGRTFTIVGNSCPLTRITSANIVPPKKTTSHSVETQKPELKVYRKKPKKWLKVGSSKKAKIVESKNANHSEPNHTWGSNATDIPSSSSLVMTGCPDCSLVSGLRMFETYDREPLSAHELSCALEKSKKFSRQPKAKDTNQEKLYLLHMDLCGPMRVASINGQRYILVIVDDYSRFTSVRFLRTKDEAPEAIIKCIKNIQVCLNANVRNVRTYNRTEFVNQTVHEFYENVGITHQTSVARTP
ncbi:retrovirus-related pol polyprotein from transposon TNT 1-94 [Tanacetum coccineum]